MTRLASIDLLRGLVIVLMALDHSRDYFSNVPTSTTTDLEKTNGFLFFTRWVTHFCAPVFILLAGVGAAFTARRLTRPQLAKYLVLRGLVLVILELTLVRLGFYFTFDFHELQGLVIWTLGWCMVLLAVLQYLPRAALIAFSLALIATHDAFRGLNPEHVMQPWRSFWIVMHVQGSIEFGCGYSLTPPYKIVPWIGVMTLGFALAPVFQRESRRRDFFILGAATIATFIAVRGFNFYGDPVQWALQDSTLKTVMSFLNCEKYPPSFCYLLMTLGPAFLMLAFFDHTAGWLGRRLILLGRVPLFFYLLHLPLIHSLALLVNYLETGAIAPWLIAVPSEASMPEGYGYPLGKVYLVWLLVVVLLYPFCAWYAAIKKNHPGGVLSYL